MSLKSNGRTTRQDTTSLQPGPIHRAVMAAFGLFLAAIGLYGLFFAQTAAMLRIPGGIVFLLLGGNAIHASWLGRESWIAKVGPLP